MASQIWVVPEIPIGTVTCISVTVHRYTKRWLLKANFYSGSHLAPVVARIGSKYQITLSVSNRNYSEAAIPHLIIQAAQAAHSAGRGPVTNNVLQYHPVTPW